MDISFTKKRITWVNKNLRTENTFDYKFEGNILPKKKKNKRELSLRFGQKLKYLLQNDRYCKDFPYVRSTA